jgi:hypothetical protein
VSCSLLGEILDTWWDGVLSGTSAPLHVHVLVPDQSFGEQPFEQAEQIASSIPNTDDLPVEGYYIAQNTYRGVAPEVLQSVGNRHTIGR